MASIISGYIKVDQLKAINPDKIIRGEKGDRIPITISVNEESRYGNNCDLFVSQSEDERKSKSPRHYLGNASVVWTDGTIVKGQKDNANQAQSKGIDTPFPTVSQPKQQGDFDDLPF
jgi:hypothetical protein